MCPGVHTSHAHTTHTQGPTADGRDTFLAYPCWDSPGHDLAHHPGVHPLARLLMWALPSLTLPLSAEWVLLSLGSPGFAQPHMHGLLPWLNPMTTHIHIFTLPTCQPTHTPPPPTPCPGSVPELMAVFTHTCMYATPPPPPPPPPHAHTGDPGGGGGGGVLQ